MAGRLPERPVKRRPEELQSFSLDGVQGVRVTLREGEAEGRPSVELLKTVRGPDDKKETQVFGIDYERFIEIGERLRGLMAELRSEEPKERTEEPRREEAKRDGNDRVRG